MKCTIQRKKIINWGSWKKNKFLNIKLIIIGINLYIVCVIEFPLG